MSNINNTFEKYCSNECEYLSIESFAYRIKGMTGVSNKWADSGNCKFIDYLNAFNNLKIDSTLLRNATVKNLEQNTLEVGDILITSASETPDECAFSSVIENDIEEGVFLDDHLFGIRIKNEYKTLINSSFINYYFHSNQFRRDLPKAIRGVTRYYVSLPDFMKLEVPLPSISLQNKIVSALDKMIALEDELKKELNMRKKQYNYYENVLLFESDYPLKKLKDVCVVNQGLYIF